MTDRREAAPPGSERARAAARRAVIRQHHPDLGGAPGALQRELEALDAGDAGPPPDVEVRPPSRWQPLARRASRARRSLGRGSRRARTRLPRGWPGARRWTEL